MNYKCRLVLCCTIGAVQTVFCQEDTTFQKTLGEVILSANKWEQQLNEVPNKVIKITKQDILRNNPQTSADLLGQSGAVFIQKSQLGGGSPMIRGFATNRVLLVVDGIRMNNAIYRSGNLQNVISIDPLSIETAEVIFGPGSLVYGSDAIGGVMDFHTLEPKLSDKKNPTLKGSVLARYSTANNENTFHADINAGFKKWAFLSSISRSDFDDLKMGKNGGQDIYLRPEYIITENNNDIVIQNNNPRVQKFSGYDQLNFLQKIRFKPNEKTDIQYAFTYAKTGKAPRYDRLIQYRNGALRFAEWYYDDMFWRMHNLTLLSSKKTLLYDHVRFTAGYQSYEEARVDRARNSNNLTKQTEKVKAISFNADVSKYIGKGELFYGIEHIYNKVGSFGQRTNTSNGSIIPFVSRYPDDSKWSTSAIYGSYKINLHSKLTLTTGLRFSYNMLDATFDTTYIKFPYKKAEINEGSLTGNAGLVFRPVEGWQINGNISTGYRMPNIDDIGKLFESIPGSVTVPNPDLSSEYAWNFEIGILKKIQNKLKVELTAFHTILDNAIERRPSTFNGDDSIVFNGVLSRVESLQNVAKAMVWGLQTSAEFFVMKNLSLQTNANFISGKETDDVNNEQVPLRHAPPFYGNTSLRYQFKKISAGLSVYYNSKIDNKNLAPSEKAKTDIYAKDDNGNPYSPGWFIINFKSSYQITSNVQLSAGWENITNQRYRPYSSGIVAAGSNFIFSIRAHL